MSNDGAFVTKTHRGKLLFLLIPTLIFVAGGIWMTGEIGVSDSRRGLGLEKATLGWISILLFGICAAVFAAMLVQRTPTIAASSEGVAVKWMFGPAYGPILWDEITGIEAGMGRNLRILLDDPQRVQQRLGKRPVLFWRANLKDRLEVPELMIDCGAAAAIDRLNDLRARYLDG
ncbi:MAG: STM3941 family protein [Pseudomonadota bacterium]